MPRQVADLGCPLPWLRSIVIEEGHCRSDNNAFNRQVLLGMMKLVAILLTPMRAPGLIGGLAVAQRLLQPVCQVGSCGVEVVLCFV